jgi:outer membrane protein
MRKMRINPLLYFGLLLLFTTTPVWALEPGLKRLTVEKAVIVALENNPMIQAATNTMSAASESVKSARAQMLPAISAGYGYTALKEKPIMKMETGDLQMAHQRQYNWDITIVQPLFAGFALKSQYDIAKLETVSRELEKQQAILDLARGVRSACYNLLLAQKLLAVSDSEVETLTAHKRDAELFYQQGLIPPNDQLKAEVALSDSLQTNERVRANEKKARIRINRLMNRPLEEPLTIEDVDETTTTAFNVEQLGAAALEQRPVMKLLETALQQLGLSEKIARGAWYPTVSACLEVTIRWETIPASDDEYNGSDESYVGVQIHWDIWQSGKTLAEVNRTQWQIKALASQIESVETEVLEEVRSAVFDCQVAHKNIGTAEKALEQASENWRITDLQYQQQIATSTERSRCPFIFDPGGHQLL